ncbi:MAG: hypothetical protein KKE69_01405 [Alphaproteobacteria bacterium]|nr:hypothetical protein [Alphaproteobacteria bacterium]MBU1606275.1 hypothetical protein [Alphaproteobacteria bacterium]
MTTLPARTPWHLWAVGAISLLWNAFGANDYLQTQLGNLEYMEGMVTDMGVSAEAALAYFIGFPGWVHAFWALGVWSSVLGSVLLLMRLRYAVWAFALALLGLAGTTFYQAISEQPEWVTSGPSAAISIVIWSIATFLLIYALSMKNKGVLR